MKYISKNVTKWLLYDCSRHNGPITLSLIASILYYCPRARSRRDTNVWSSTAAAAAEPPSPQLTEMFCSRLYRVHSRQSKRKNSTLINARKEELRGERKSKLARIDCAMTVSTLRSLFFVRGPVVHAAWW